MSNNKTCEERLEKAIEYIKYQSKVIREQSEQTVILVKALEEFNARDAEKKKTQKSKAKLKSNINRQLMILFVMAIFALIIYGYVKYVK